MKVGDILLIAHSISDKVHTTTPTANVESISKTIANKGIGALPVVSEGKLVGIISERDIVTKVVAKGLKPRHTLVHDIMTPNPTIIFFNYSLEDCLDLMEKGRFRHLPVVDKNRLVGMISIRDVLVALLKEKVDLTAHYERYLIANH